MTQVYADDEAATVGMFARGGRTPAQSIPVRSSPLQSIPEPREQSPETAPATSSSALTPGKGVRAVRCVGCCQDTLPRSDDGAPLCARCSEVLANALQSVTGPTAQLSGPFTGWTVRWLRRRDDAQLG
jgi:hypothetical protein